MKVMLFIFVLFFHMQNGFSFYQNMQEKENITNKIELVKSTKDYFDKLSEDKQNRLLSLYYKSLNNCVVDTCIAEDELFTVYVNKKTKNLYTFIEN